MTFSIRAALLAITFFAIWLGAIISRSPVGLELASLVTVLVLFLSLPLAIFDSERRRRPFWAGFCAVGLGFFLTISIVDTPIHKTTTAIANLAMKIPGANAVPPSSTTQVAPLRYMTQDGSLTPPKMQPITSTVTMHDAISGAVPYLLVFVLASLGGVTVFWLAQHSRTGQNAV